MKEQQRQIAQLIYEKVKMRGSYTANWYKAYQDIENATAPEFADEWLLGFLCSKETLIAWFGDEKYTWCGFNKDTHGDFEDVCWCNAHQESFPSNRMACWQYHDHQMSGMTALERLDYYAKSELSQIAKESEKKERSKWENRGIITTCHGCDKTVHIFPEDVKKLMYPSLEQIKEKQSKERKV